MLVHRHHLEQQRLAQEAQAYRVRAEQGEAEAQYDLARMYSRGRGVPQSYAEALQWYRAAANQNLEKAQYSVGYSYYYGYGTDGDFKEALRWFRLAADQKDPRAEDQIGIAYAVGNGVTADYSEAVRWYRLSADQGYAAAQYNLGWMYANGRGVTKDRVEARKWVAKAADQGYPYAKQMLGRSWPALSKIKKMQLIIPLIGGILLLFPSRTFNLGPKSQVRGSTAMVGLGVLFCVALDLLSSAYAGILAPPLVVWPFGFARAFVWGALLPFVLRMVWPNSPSWTLWASGILFIGLNGLVVARGFNRPQIESAVRLLVWTNGHVLGLGITSAVLLLRMRRNGERGGPSGRDEIARTGDGEVAHS
ncbi:MAG: tetratricopeptide repeat protein [Terracidiphilus sp.]|nr:tetratricopeptide repeat protein [Terracidiphilus sp.]